MSSGGGKKVSRDLDLCNLFIKFFLFTINLIVWVSFYCIKCPLVSL